MTYCGICGENFTDVTVPKMPPRRILHVFFLNVLAFSTIDGNVQEENANQTGQLIFCISLPDGNGVVPNDGTIFFASEEWTASSAGFQGFEP